MTEYLTSAHCAARAADALGLVPGAVSADFAQAHLAAAHAWMDLGRLLDDRPAMRPELESPAEPAEARARNLMQLELVAEIEVTKGADIVAQQNEQPDETPRST